MKWSKQSGIAALVLGAAAAMALLVGCSGGDEARDEGGVGQTLLAEPASPAEDGSAGYGSSQLGETAPESAPSKGGALPGGSTTGGDLDAQASADLLGRKVIRNGALSLEVESVADSYDQVSALATSLGGYVSEASFFGDEESRNARLVIRVPAESFDRAVADLRGLAKEVRSISSTTQDATAQVTDLEATLRNLRAVEAQYVELLTRADEIADILQVQERLREVRAEIEQTEGRLALLNRLSDLATITVELMPVPVAVQVSGSSDSPADAASAAWEASLDTLRNGARIAVAVVVYSWWLLPLAAIGLFIGRRVLRARRDAAPADPTPA